MLQIPVRDLPELRARCAYDEMVGIIRKFLGLPEDVPEKEIHRVAYKRYYQSDLGKTDAELEILLPQYRQDYAPPQYFFMWAIKAFAVD